LTYEKPYHVRFIEMMPAGEHHAWTGDRFISADEILERIRPLGSITPLRMSGRRGPKHCWSNSA